ncbi:MAG: (2Fe-2S)-binding protein [Spirochaetes bacterium]|nr:(2Fe-2S)-binding protein [Spirochaetota bacterium]
MAKGLTASENNSHYLMIVCCCANINDRQVKEALAEGARTLADVQVKLGAAMGCGRCRDAVNEEISKFCGATAGGAFFPADLAHNA